MNFSVIIASAGSSTRMNGTDKQLLLIDNTPVIVKSIFAFDDIDEVNQIILVVNKNNKQAVQSVLEKYSYRHRIIITEGGSSRQESVFNGIKLIDNNCDYIAIHDGARPLVRKQDIINVFDNAVKYGASTLGVPCKDTIKIIRNSFIESTPCRNTLYITQTPQVFKKDMYLKCMEYAENNNLDFTDDCQLFEKCENKVFMTEGHYDNIKITTPEDIVTATSLVKKGD